MRLRSLSACSLVSLAVLLAGCGGGGGGGGGNAAPAITAQPQSLSVAVGQAATFSVASVGSAPLSYQWQQGGTPIAGATASSLTVPAVSYTDNGNAFSVTVTNTAGSVTSAAATLTVLPPAPTISAQPASVTVSAGQPVIFSVTASSSAPLTYQWQQNGSAIAGATSASYEIAAAGVALSGSSYSVIVSNSGASVTSAAATLTVNAIAPGIIAQPASVAVSAGQPAVFSVSATGTGPLVYQWQRGGVNIGGATAASYDLAATALTDNGASFDVIVSNAAGSITSAAAVLTVNPIAPSITIQPSSASVFAGQPAVFSVVAGGSAPLSYQWKMNGASISGATAASYTLASTALSNNGESFQVSVGNAAGNIVSSAATLTVNPVAPSITVQPQPQTISDGGTATFSVGASGTAPLTYQWLKNGANISGATGSSYTTPVLNVAASGTSYSVVVHNAASTSATSNAVTVTVNPVAPSISTQPQSQSAAVGAIATFTVVASGSAPLSYQWQMNGANISGATTASYTTPTLSSAQNGATFDVIVSNAASPAAVSNTVTLTVSAVAPSITSQPQSQTVTDGSTATFSVVASGSAPLSYQWKKNGVAISGATSASYTTPTVSASDSGSGFTVVVSNAVSPAATSQAAVLTVTHSLTLIAGELGNAGHADGTGTAATFYNPVQVATDSSGNVYVADQMNDTIRVITPAGVVSTLAGTPGVAGSSNGTGAAALFNSPGQLAVDSSGNVYVADSGNQVIRMITSAGVVSTYAGSVGVSGSSNSPALFNGPTGLALYQPVNGGPVTLFVADTNSETIREISSSGTVSTFAGSAYNTGSSDGTGSAASFSLPKGLAINPSTGDLYVADSYNNTIRHITPGGTVSTLAGGVGVYGSNNGTGSGASFDDPVGVGLDPTGAYVYVADLNNQLIRQVTTGGGVVTTVAGSAGVMGASNGSGSAASFLFPGGVATDANGDIYVADATNNLVREITSGNVSTFAGNIGGRGYANGTGTAARFDNPHYVCTDLFGDTFVADHYNNVIRMISSSGVVSTLAGTPGPGGYRDGASALFNAPYGITTDAAGNVYVADANNSAVRKISMPSAVVSTVAGGSYGNNNGTGTAAQFEQPYALAIDSSGNIFVADFDSNAIREINPSAVVSTFAGSPGNAGSNDGTGTAARFWGPRGITIDSSNNLYVADRNNGTVRKITPAAVVSTLAGTAGVIGFRDGTGGAAEFNWPNGPSVDSAGNVYVADSNNHAVRMITPSGVVTTIVGNQPGASLSFSVALGVLPASLDGPSSVAVVPGSSTQLLITDATENSLLMATLP